MNKNILWKKNCIENALKTTIPFELEAREVSIDTRTISQGSLFIAIKGERFNGNHFIGQALSKGAVGCIIDELSNMLHPRAQSLIIEVPDTFIALQNLARFRRKQISNKVIGITGSVGKTSTKEMLNIVFKANARTFSNKGNFNNHYGLPLSLCNTPKDTEFGIYELGMSNKGEISELTKLLQPNIAIITNIHPVHLEFFKSVYDIALAKAEIFESMDRSRYTILNKDNEFYSTLSQKAKEKSIPHIAVGIKDADISLNKINVTDSYNAVEINCFGRKVTYQMAASVGNHMIFNSLFVAAALNICNLDIEENLNRLMDFEPYKGRGAVIKFEDGIKIIDESYNASPIAVKAAIKNLAGFKKNNTRIIAVLGDMKELGENSQAFHEELINDIIDAKVDKVFCVGKMMYYLFKKLPNSIKGEHAESSQDISKSIGSSLSSGDVIMIKGSLSMNMKHIVEYIKMLKTKKQLFYG